MAGQTAIYALPYQSLTDPPHGPNLGQDLAEAVEDELARIDASIGPKGRIGGRRYNAGTGVGLAAGVGPAESLINMSSGSLTLKANRGYEPRARVRVLTSNAASVLTLRLRETNLTGVVRATCNVTLAAANFFHEIEFGGLYETGGADETKTLVVTSQTNTGTATFNAGDSTLAVYVEVHDVGASGLLAVV